MIFLLVDIFSTNKKMELLQGLVNAGCVLCATKKDLAAREVWTLSCTGAIDASNYSADTVRRSNVTDVIDGGNL